MRVAAAIGEASAGFGDHGEIEHELEPVGAATHLEKARLPRFETAVPARLHREEVFKCNFLLSLIGIRDNALGEELQHRLLNVAQVALLNCQTD